MAPIFFETADGFKIPAIGLGTWMSTDESELENALDAALEAGYRHIDTAYVYGNEHIVGRVLKKWFSSGKLKREDVFVTTKLPMNGTHPDRVEMFLKKSLDNLKLDYVDLYLIHFPVGTQHVEGDKMAYTQVAPEPVVDHIAIWKKMEAQVDAGRTRSIGLSTFNIRQIERILKSCRIKPKNLQVEIHLYLQEPELVEYCKKNDISIVAYCPLGNPGYNTFVKNLGKEEKVLPDVLHNSTVMEIAQRHKKTTAQVALRFLFQNGIIPIPRSVKQSRIKENFDIFNFELDAEELKKLRGLHVGEEARICDRKVNSKAIQEHQEFPFPLSKT